MALLLLSFIAGLLTVLAPCILPLLPVIIGGSLSDTRSRLKPYVITGSLTVSVVLFTLLLKSSTTLIMVPPEFWTWLSGSIVFFFGLTLLFPVLWEKIPGVSQLLVSSNRLVGEGASRQSFVGDILIGAALAPVFASCSPTYFIILATVLPVDFGLGIIYLLSYALGLGLALLGIALLGKRLTARLNRVADPYGWFKRGLGIIFILVAIGILSGYDKKLQIAILDAGFFDITKFENVFIEKLNPADNVSAPTPQSETENETNESQVSKKNTLPSFLSSEEKAKRYKKFIELSSPDGFVNTNGKPITIGELVGKKVILLDIWTYSCINCQRTLPYLKSWYEKYQDQGLEIIGLHTPEFAFERVYKNVAKAAKDFGLTYPIVLDNDYSTWNAYGNRFWPRKYLIDIDGYIVYDHIGEGAYEETEKKIQEALEERMLALDIDKTINVELTKETKFAVEARSPETYFGALRNEYFGNGERGRIGVQSLDEPATINPHTLYLVGDWNITSEYAVTTPAVKLSNSAYVKYRYLAKSVYLVAGGTNGTPVTFEVLRDGAPLSTTVAGKDVFYENGKSYVRVSDERLYKIIEDVSSGDHLLEFIISSPGLEAYAFTFG